MGDLELGGKSGSESGVCGRGGLGGFAPEGGRVGGGCAAGCDPGGSVVVWGWG